MEDVCNRPPSLLHHRAGKRHSFFALADNRFGLFPPTSSHSPLIALTLLLGNGIGGFLIRRWVDDFAAYLLWGGTVVIQMLFWLAVFSLIL